MPGRKLLSVTQIMTENATAFSDQRQKHGKHNKDIKKQTLNVHNPSLNRSNVNEDVYKSQGLACVRPVFNVCRIGIKSVRQTAKTLVYLSALFI